MAGKNYRDIIRAVEPMILPPWEKAEHPARISLGADFAIREFGPGCQRASLMQATLAALGFLAAMIDGWNVGDAVTAVAAAPIGLVIPFTLFAMAPTNKRLIAPASVPSNDMALLLLARWNRLLWVCTILSGLAFDFDALAPHVLAHQGDTL